MTRQDHLLVILMEECAEVQKECAKALRFGLDDYYAPAGDDTNRESIVKELDDLIAVVEMLEDEDILEPGSFDRQELKKEKVEKFLKYSKAKGLLEEKVL